MEHEDIRITLKENVRYFRNQRQISQQILAERCGVSTTYIGEIEIGRKYPSLQTLTKLAESLQVETYQLLMPHQYRENSELDRFAHEVQEHLGRLVDEVRKRY